MARIHIMAGAGDKLDMPVIRTINMADLGEVLRSGIADFSAKPSHYVLLMLIYPIIGIVLTIWMNGFHTWPLLYPLIGGFALLGPIAALPLYEISRRREAGEDPGWGDAMAVFRSPAIGSIMAVGVMLFVLFTLWLTAAQALYEGLFGSSPPDTLAGLFTQVTTSPEGATLLLVGTALGALFAIVVLCTSVIAFPLLLDRDVGAYVAVETSFRAVLYNRVPLFAWGLLVGFGIFLGSLPIFVGLAVVLPIFGHATWHLYRKLVEPASVIRGM
ncbi:DUF2189 domain-containing protein [Devosia elaeis]|jgi:uncharacterized membrane protein|uniref:Cytochrome C oxidase subunit I n=1 Tax=Devosia elaeis TaxID=1770058 RepID=A0A178HUK1_9HYPH|nr:DUF2189 domain-containing protein [Devosia elaeis]OAM76551.1 hypothetical protein A3840_12295 [Devosia elaeis]